MRAPRLRLLVALAVSSGACASTVVWQGKTPDRRAVVQVLEGRKGQWLEAGGHRHPLFDGIGVDALAMSTDGKHIAYPARRGDAWFVVREDGREQGPWGGVGELLFSPDGARLAFSVERDGAWQVMVDGQPGPRCESIYAGSMTWSPSGKHLAYAASQDGQAHAMIDQVAGPPFDGIGWLLFAGDRPVYAARTGATSHLVIDGVLGPEQDSIDDVVSSPGGAHVVHVAMVGGAERVFLDGREVPGARAGVIRLPHVSDAGDLTYVLSGEGGEAVVRHGEEGLVHPLIAELAVAPGGGWAYLAAERPTGDLDDDRIRVVIDGVPRRTYAHASDLVFSPDGKHLAYLAQHGHAPIEEQHGTERARGRPTQIRRVVVHDGEETQLDAAVGGTLVWSRDSRHWACLSGELRTRDVFITIDGTRRRPIDFHELVFLAERPSLPPATAARQLRDMVAAELELALAAR